MRCVYRQDDIVVQAEVERGGVHNSDDRIQRRDSVAMSRSLVHRLGCRRAGQASTSMETLLPEHWRLYLASFKTVTIIYDHTACILSWEQPAVRWKCESAEAGTDGKYGSSKLQGWKTRDCHVALDCRERKRGRRKRRRTTDQGAVSHRRCVCKKLRI